MHTHFIYFHKNKNVYYSRNTRAFNCVLFLDLILNKAPFYKNHAQNITLNTSEVIFVLMLLNICRIEKVSNKVVDPTGLYIIYNSPTMSYFFKRSFEVLFFVHPKYVLS